MVLEFSPVWGKLRWLQGQAGDVWAGGVRTGGRLSQGGHQASVLGRHKEGEGRRAGDEMTRGAVPSIFMLFDPSCTAMHGFTYQCGQIV